MEEASFILLWPIPRIEHNSFQPLSSRREAASRHLAFPSPASSYTSIQGYGFQASWPFSQTLRREEAILPTMTVRSACTVSIVGVSLVVLLVVLLKLATSMLSFIHRQPMRPGRRDRTRGGRTFRVRAALRRGLRNKFSPSLAASFASPRH